MVGKNNYQKAVKANLQEHHKAYKVGKRWVYASISSLAFGSMLFFSGQLTSFADTTTADAATNSTTSAANADSSSVTLKTAASSANNSDAVTNQTAAASSSAATSSVAKTILNNPTDSELTAAKTSAAANYAATAQPQEVNAIAGTPTTANKIKIESDVATLGNGTTPLNSGGAVTNYTVTVTFSNVKAGDVVTYTLPTNLDLLKYVSTVNMVAGTGTTTVTKNDDGTVTITDTITQDLVGINIQTSKVTSYNNNADIAMSPDQSGKTVVGYITSTYNGVADGSFAITQTYTPSITIPTSPTRNDPTPSVISSVLPNTDYVYKFALAETPDFIAVGGDTFAQPSQQVRRMLNTGGAVITIPVPSSFVLNSSLTTDLNGLGGSTTTITQTGKGADIIITVPAGNGVSGGNLTPYFLAGSYDITQTSSNQTVTAASGATISQVAPNGMVTASTADNSVWTEQIAAANQADTETTATVSGKGNSSTAVDKLILNAGPDAPQYINQVTVNTDSAYEITDAQITFNIPDGIDGTGFTVPEANNSYTNKNGQYTRGTTEYSYTVTHADGTVETGTVADGDTFTSSKTSPIRTIVLTPNYLAPGAGVYSFNLVGTLSDNYDDGTAVAVGDQLVFTQSVNYPSNQNANDPITATNTETVVEGVAQLRGYLQPKDSQTTPGRGAGSYLANQSGNWGQTTNYVYEPIMYFVLPSYASLDYVKVPEADLAGGVKVSYYTTDTGAKGVKIDYSGTGLYMNAGAGTGVYGVALEASPIDTVAGLYPSYYYIYSPQTTIVTGAKNAPVTDLTLTDGDANAVLVYSPNWKIETVRSTTSFNFGQGNQDSEAVASGTSQVTGDSTINFYTNMVNSLAAETTNTSEVINLPTIGDSSGSTYTFKLNGPIELPKSFTNAANTDNPLSEDAKVLYSVSLYDDTGTATSPDTTGYMTADELTAAGYDWSDVRSIYIDVESIPVDNSTGRIKISGTTDDFPKQVGKIGYLESIYYANDANPAVGKQAASVAIIGTSDVKAQFHYVDNSGKDVYIPLPDLTKTYNDDVDTMNTTDFPASEADFNATDLALIPTDYKLATNADGSLQQSIINSDVPNYSGLPNDTAAFGQTVVYYFDGDTVTYELTNGKATATVTYVDDDKNQSVVGEPSKITGLIGTKGTYTATPPTLYDLAPKQSNKIDYVIATDGSDDITVHLVHQHEAGTATSTYTVKTAGLPTNKAIPDDSKTENWTTNTDKVTNVVTYTPIDKTIDVTPTEVDGYSVAPASHTFTFTEGNAAPTAQEVTFVYSANSQTTNIKFVDDDKSGAPVGNPTPLTGTTDSTKDWTADVPEGYALAKDQKATGTYTFNASSNPDIVIHLVHVHEAGTATSTYTVKTAGLPTDKAIADDPKVENWTTDTDKVTNAVTYTPTDKTIEVTPTQVPGYSVEPASHTFTFTEGTTAPTAQDFTFIYTANPQTTNIKYVDDDLNGDPVGKATPFNGTTDATETWNADVPEGYALAKGQDATGDYTFSASSNPDIVIHLVHVHEAGTATSTYTVKTAGLPADKAIADDPKTENWITDTDKVTNVVTYTPTDTTIDVTPTEVDGYSVTPASHTFTFTEDTTAPTDQEFTFEYSADPQTLTINYVDVSTGNQVATATKDGTTDEPVDYAADQVPDNYVLAKGQAATGTKTLTTDPANNVVVINVAPSVGHTTKTTTQTVKYLLQGTETPLHAETKQVVTWNVSTNAVTGDVIATPQGLYAETTAPVIAGYTPTTGSVPLDKLVAGTTLPEDTSATIFYTANGQSLAITYIDDSTHTTVASDSVPGKTNESVNYTANKIPANYVLAIGQAATGSQTLSADATKNTVIIHVVPVVEHSTQDTTQTVNYVVAGTTHALKEPTTQTITWNISTNAVTGEVIATPQGAYAATGAPTIAGYTPDKTSVAATTPTASTKLPENTSATINYTADPQTLTITYVDDSTKTSVGNDSVDGVTDQDVSYTADKVPANYTLAIGQAESGIQTLSADATKNTVTIHVVPVVNHTTQNTTQTVNYVVSGTDTALTDPTTQTITWNISTNAVTGEIIATAQAGYAATTAPTIAGYTPDRKTVAADSPAPSTTMPKDSTETINYTAYGQTLTINYVDDSTHTNVGTDTATGVTNGTVAYQADKVPANYVLATGQAMSGTQILSADPTKNVVTIHVVPAVAHTTQTTTQTVNYVLAGTTTTMQDPTTQQITWNISTNQVTGEMVATPQGGYAATTAPTIAGYTPDQTSVAADNPVALTTLPKDSSATISYTADPQTLTINYVDGATGKTVATDTVPGTTDEVVNYTADKVPANYVLANGQGTTGTQTLTADPTKNVATIKVVPAVTHSTQVTTQTVNYVLAGTTTALKTPTTQQITWNISTDQVTGDVIATPQGGYAATTAPTIAGYTPDQTSVAADNPAAMTTLPADSSATISYAADPQTLTVAYIDDVTGATISTDTATGVTDQTGTYTVTVPANYELATGQAGTVAYTLNADSAKNNVEVHLTHHISHTTTTTTRTINYLVQGSDAQVTDPDVQTITWNVSTDDVTNASVATPQDGYAEVTAPTITGYTADTPVVAAENPAPTSADQLAGETVNVYYILTETDDNGEGDNGTPSQPTDEGTTTPTDTNNGQVTVPTETGTPSGTQAVKVTGTQQTKATTNKLPQTDEKANSMALIGLGLMSFMSFMGLARTKKHD